MIKLLVFGSILLASTNAQESRKFPDGFVFGAATASYQVEGAWDVAGKGENIWDYLTHNSDLIVDKSSGDVACNSYNLFKSDVQMLKNIGFNYYRFSISWSRILPTGLMDQVNPDGIRYYNDLIDELIANGVEPAITLYHWDLPQKLQELGGWTNPLMADYFEEYAKICFAAFGDRVKKWLTFNEPRETCIGGYGDGHHAPAYHFSGIGDYLCAHTIIKAHARVYHMYHDQFNSDGNGKISLTLNVDWIEPEGDNVPENIEASKRGLEFTLGWYANPIYSEEGDYPKVMKDRILAKSLEQGFSSSRLPSFTPEEIESIKGTNDFFGINHYTTVMGKKSNGNMHRQPSFYDDQGIDTYQPSDWPESASSWLKVVPWGFRKVLNYIKDTYDNPEVVVFENGFSDHGELDDQNRVNYYFLYLNALLDAIEDGCDVTAYTAWSLMDNFEWFRGYTERFGIYHVDFNDPNRARTPKASANFFAELIQNRTLQRP